jgi:hypothetical protein
MLRHQYTLEQLLAVQGDGPLLVVTAIMSPAQYTTARTLHHAASDCQSTQLSVIRVLSN